MEKYIASRRRAAEASKKSVCSPSTELMGLDNDVLLRWSKFNLRVSQQVVSTVRQRNSSIQEAVSVPKATEDGRSSILVAADEMKAVVENIKQAVTVEETMPKRENEAFFQDIYTSIQVVTSGLFVLQLQCQQSGAIDDSLKEVLEGMRMSCADIVASLEDRR